MTASIFFYTQDNIRPGGVCCPVCRACREVGGRRFPRRQDQGGKGLVETLPVNTADASGRNRRRYRKSFLNQKKVDIYTASREDLGVPAIDRKGPEGFIDSIPEIPIAVRDNLKEDARIKKFDLKKTYDL